MSKILTLYNKIIRSIKHQEHVRFAEKQNKTIEEDVVIVSFDMKSLFASVAGDQAYIAVEEPSETMNIYENTRASMKNRS